MKMPPTTCEVPGCDRRVAEARPQSSGDILYVCGQPHVYGADDPLSGWCASCGHKGAIHVGHHRCGGLARIGPGDGHDGGDFAACRCDGFVPLRPSRPSDLRT